GQVRSLSSPSADVGIRVPEQTERDSQVFGLIPTKGLRFFLLLGHPRESDHDHDGERRKSKPSFRSDGLEPSGPTFGGKPVAKESPARHGPAEAHQESASRKQQIREDRREIRGFRETAHQIRQCGDEKSDSHIDQAALLSRGNRHEGKSMGNRGVLPGTAKLRRLSTWIITGGAGFIGSNFVLQARASTPHRLVVFDALTY